MKENTTQWLLKKLAELLNFNMAEDNSTETKVDPEVPAEEKKEETSEDKAEETPAETEPEPAE